MAPAIVASLHALTRPHQKHDVPGHHPAFPGMTDWAGFGDRRPRSGHRPRLSRDWPSVVYAIGDVHGRLDLLRELEAAIVSDATGIAGEKLLVMLGDYVDRGAQSGGVLDHLLAPPPSGFSRIALAGNHEDLMLDFLDNPDPNHNWLRLGGDRTLQSYGIDTRSLFNGDISASALAEVIASAIPAQHVTLLRTLPVCLSLPRTVLVHAGIRRNLPMDEQSEQDMLWLRPRPDEPVPNDDLLVVHGHTPADHPYVSRHRICIDTGAFATGVLTAARLGPNGLQALIASNGTKTTF